MAYNPKPLSEAIAKLNGAFSAANDGAMGLTEALHEVVLNRTVESMSTMELRDRNRAIVRICREFKLESYEGLWVLSRMTLKEIGEEALKVLAWRKDETKMIGEKAALDKRVEAFEAREPSGRRKIRTREL